MSRAACDRPGSVPARSRIAPRRHEITSTRPELETTVRSILRELFPDHEVDALSGDADLAEALDLDSMALIDLVLELERRTGIDVPDEDLQQLTSIDAVVEYVGAALAR